MYDFSVYEGKAQGQEISECKVSRGIVLKLTKTLPKNAGFKIFADNYFTSVLLVEKLLNDGFFYAGTIRFPRMRQCEPESEKTMKKEGRGSTDFKILSDENIIIMRWFDNKPVNLISSYVAVEPIDSVRCYDQREETYTEAPRPNILKVYNTYMGGTDKLDMICALYKGQIKSRLFPVIVAQNLHWRFFFKCRSSDFYGIYSNLKGNCQQNVVFYIYFQRVLLRRVCGLIQYLILKLESIE